jgi:hypothetical protein
MKPDKMFKEYAIPALLAVGVPLAAYQCSEETLGDTVEYAMCAADYADVPGPVIIEPCVTGPSNPTRDAILKVIGSDPYEVKDNSCTAE